MGICGNWNAELSPRLNSFSFFNKHNKHIFIHSFKDFIYLFLEKGKGGREEEKYQCVVAFCAPPTGDLAHNPGMCPDWESNLRPFGSQGGIQSTEPPQPGPDPIPNLAISALVEDGRMNDTLPPSNLW